MREEGSGQDLCNLEVNVSINTVAAAKCHIARRKDEFTLRRNCWGGFNKTRCFCDFITYKEK